MWFLAFIILFALMILITIIDSEISRLIHRIKYGKPKPPYKFGYPTDPLLDPIPHEVFRNYGSKKFSMDKMLGLPGEEAFMEAADEWLIIEKMGVYRNGIKVIVSDTDEVEPIYDLI